MGKSLDRFRAKNKYYERGLDIMVGDAYEEYLPVATSALSEITTKAIEAKKESEKRKSLELAQKKLIDAKATLASADLKESDKNGPLHVAAKQQLINAQSALEKLLPDSASDKGKMGGPSGGAEPWWKWPAIIGGGGLAVLTVYLLLRKK